MGSIWGQNDVLRPNWDQVRKKKIISKYSIYHAKQPSPKFIWVETTLKWTKCPKTAQIVEKWQ